MGRGGMTHGRMREMAHGAGRRMRLPGPYIPIALYEEVDGDDADMVVFVDGNGSQYFTIEDNPETETGGLDSLGDDVVVIGATFDLQAMRRKMDAAKVVSLDMARELLKGGQKAIDAARQLAKDHDLPGGTARDNVYWKLQWHADQLAKLLSPATQRALVGADATAPQLYGSADDLKKWVLEAFIEQNAAEEGVGTQAAMTYGQGWDDMWYLVDKEAAKLPTAVRAGVGKFVEAATGIPVWLWAIGGAIVVGLVGYGLWRVLMTAAPVATKVVADRYLPPGGRG